MDWKDEVTQIINEILPENSQILLLSLTGSRAFGWAGDNMDYDVHGIFLCPNYWDWVHLGKKAYDINLYEFTHILSDMQYQHFTTFMNLSNPFHIHPKFDFDKLLSFCTPLAAKYKGEDIKSQINRFDNDNSPRTALHAYRIMMVPLHFLESRKFELNIFKLNESYGFKELDSLKAVYSTCRGAFSKEQVKQDLDYLYGLYISEIEKCETSKVDMQQANEWFNTTKEGLK